MRLIDLRVPSSLGANLPIIDQLKIRRRGSKSQFIDSHQIQNIDWAASEILIADAREGPRDDGGDPKDRLWLKRDVLDAMVLELPRRRATRVSDLWLRFSEKGLEVFGADLSYRGLLRRFGLPIDRRNDQACVIEWSQIAYIPEEAPDQAAELSRLSAIPPGEIALMLAEIAYPEAVTLLGMLPEKISADVLEILPRVKQVQLFEELDKDLSDRLLALMAPNDCADVLGHLPVDEALRKLEQLPPQHRDRILDLLRYPPGTVGGIMTNDVISTPMDATIGETRRRLQEKLKEPDFIHFLYIVDDEKSKRLRGVLTIRRLLTEKETASIEDVMADCVTVLQPLDSASTGAWRVLASNLAALPVVGNDHKLLGVVTVDAAVAEVASAAWAGQSPRIFS